MTDIVQLLRELAECKHSDLSVASDGADEIEALLAEVERLRAALDDISDGLGETDLAEVGRYAKHIARAALENTNGK